MRSRAIAVAATVGLLAAAGVSASASAPPQLRLRLFVPHPGHVTLEAITMRFAGPHASSLQLRPRLAILRLRSRVGAAVVVKTRRRGNRTTYTILVAVVNAASPRRLADNGAGPPIVLPPTLVERVNKLKDKSKCLLDGVNALRAVPNNPTVFLGVPVAPLPGYGEQPGYLYCRNGPDTVNIESFTLIDVDSLKLGQRAAAAKTLTELFETPDVLDAKSGASWQAGPDSAIETSVSPSNPDASAARNAIVDAVKLLDAPPDQLDEIIQKIEDSLNVAPPAPQLYRYSFTGLVDSFDIPVPNSSPNHIVQSYSGELCGTSPGQGGPWAITVSSTGSPTHIDQIDFTKQNPATMLIITSDGDINGQAVSKLQLTATPPAQMGLSVTLSGDYLNLAGAPSQVPITATPVPFCP